jgi:hypothetical protein
VDPILVDCSECILHDIFIYKLLYTYLHTHTCCVICITIKLSLQVLVHLFIYLFVYYVYNSTLTIVPGTGYHMYVRLTTFKSININHLTLKPFQSLVQWHSPPNIGTRRAHNAVCNRNTKCHILPWLRANPMYQCYGPT